MFRNSLHSEVLGGIEFIHERDDVRRLQTIVTEPLPHLGPVFLLHMGIVVFL
jgi:hypothetical protein